MNKKILSDSVIYALAPQLPKLVSLLMLPIITQHMTAEDYGISGIIAAYMAAFDAFKDLGLRVNLTSSFVKYPTRFKWVWRRLHGFIQLWAIIYGLLLSILLWFILPDMAMKNYPFIAILVLSPIMFFEPVFAIGRDYFQLNKKPIPISIISLIASLIAIATMYITIVMFNMGYLGLLMGLFTASLFTMLVYVYLIYWVEKMYPSWQFNYNWIQRKLKIALPTIPHYYAGYIINISDRVLLDLLKVPIKEIGMYSFAYSIGAYFSIIGKSYMQASGPYLMEYYKSNTLIGDYKALKQTNSMQVFFISAAFILSLWAKEAFQFLARNPELSNSFYIAIIIFFSFTYYPSYSYNAMKIWLSEKTKTILNISVISAIISVVLNVCLIPFIGILGAAISTFVSMLFMGYGGYLYPSIRKLFKTTYKWWIWAIVTPVLLLLALYLCQSTIITKLIVSFLILLLVSIYYYQTNKVTNQIFKSYGF